MDTVTSYITLKTIFKYLLVILVTIIFSLLIRYVFDNFLNEEYVNNSLLGKFLSFYAFYLLPILPLLLYVIIFSRTQLALIPSLIIFGLYLLLFFVPPLHIILKGLLAVNFIYKIYYISNNVLQEITFDWIFYYIIELIPFHFIHYLILKAK
jgi:hypothetical protein